MNSRLRCFVSGLTGRHSMIVDCFVSARFFLSVEPGRNVTFVLLVELSRDRKVKLEPEIITSSSSIVDMRPTPSARKHIREKASV